MAAHEPDFPGGDVSIDLMRTYASEPTFTNIEGNYRAELSPAADDALNRPEVIRVVTVRGRKTPWPQGTDQVPG